LSEAADADLLLHVIDASATNREDQIAAVDAVLAAIGADGVPQLRVYNKSDLAHLPAGAERDACGNICSIRTSASTGAGCADLRTALAERFPRDHTTPPATYSLSTPALSR
jgi:GTP-binding protein HflX